MADFKNPYGPQALTTVESGNAIAQRRTIRVFPTLADDAISGNQGDVLINRAEIPNAVLQPGGCSVLLNSYIVDYEDVGTDEDFFVIFHSVSAADFGTLDATADISVADLKANKILGLKRWDKSSGGVGAFIDNARINELDSMTGNIGSASAVNKPIFLQAEENSTSVYFSVVQNNTTTATPDWDTGDLEFIFHIDY